MLYCSSYIINGISVDLSQLKNQRDKLEFFVILFSSVLLEALLGGRPPSPSTALILERQRPT